MDDTDDLSGPIGRISVLSKIPGDVFNITVIVWGIEHVTIRFFQSLIFGCRDIQNVLGSPIPARRRPFQK